MNDTSGNTVALSGDGETVAVRRPCMKADPVWRVDLPYPSVINTWIILMVALVVMTGCYSYSPPEKKVWGFVDGVHDGVYYNTSTNTGTVGKCGRVTSEPIDHPKNHNIPHVHRTYGSIEEHSSFQCTFDYPYDTHENIWGSYLYTNTYRNYDFTYHQLREDEFVIHATFSSIGGEKNEGEFENFILIVTAAIGDYEGFKYGIFDQVSTTTDHDQGETVTTSHGTGTAGSYGTGVAGTTYGAYFGSDQRTTTTKTVGESLTIERRHHVKFYRSKPDSNAYFDIALMKKSVARGSDYKLRFHD